MALLGDGRLADHDAGDGGRLQELRESCGQGYVLRVPSNFHLTLAAGVTDLRAGRHATAGRSALLGGPLGRDGLQGAALVCLGLAGRRLAPPSPAGPPPTADGRTGLLLLPRARILAPALLLY
jgi:hypothetical protein